LISIDSEKLNNILENDTEDILNNAVIESNDNESDSNSDEFNNIVN